MVILGCGYIGEALARAALASGEPVAALTRNAARAAELRALGVSPVIEADLASSDWHAALHPSGADIINCVSPSSPGEEGYRHSFLAGLTSVRNWLETSTASGARPARSVVFTSSTAVYPQTDGNWVDEGTPVDSAKLGSAGVILAEAEKHWIELSPNLAQRAWVLRLAGIYGPGRHHLLDALRKGETTFPDGNHWINLIYRDDVVAAIRACATAPSDIHGGIFNLADNEPVQKRDLILWLAQQLGQNPAAIHFDQAENTRSAHRRTSSGVIPDRRISSAKFQKAAKWNPLCRSYQEGYKLMLS